MRTVCKCVDRDLLPNDHTKSMNTAVNNARESPSIESLTKDEMVEWFQSAPIGPRHERMLWATRKIAHLTGATEGGAYKRLLIALIEAEGRLDPREFKDCA